MSDQTKPSSGLKQLGQYKLLKRLGEGAMGIVFLAEDSLMLRKVAVKVLPKKFTSDSTFLSRFKREAKAAGRLNHANIVAAFAVGEDHGHHYYVMEYYDGESLDHTLAREKRLPWKRALEISKEVADGLAYAHKHGLIHRDIKPANIFITKDNDSKILDLGLSKNFQGEADAFQTQSGLAVGTPHYLSPEQAQGRSDLDGRTDLYSLGATLFHLLTGQQPFDGENGAVIMTKHITDPVPDPLSIRKDLPPEVAQIVRKCMAKLPDDRYPGCGDLIEDIQKVLSGKQLQTTNGSNAPAIRPKPQQRPTLRQNSSQRKTGRTTATQNRIKARGETDRHEPISESKVPAILASAGGLLLVLILAGIFLTGSDTENTRPKIVKKKKSTSKKTTKVTARPKQRPSMSPIVKEKPATTEAPKSTKQDPSASISMEDPKEAYAKRELANLKALLKQNPAGSASLRPRFQRLIENYGGTHSGQAAAILLKSLPKDQPKATAQAAKPASRDLFRPDFKNGLKNWSIYDYPNEKKSTSIWSAIKNGFIQKSNIYGLEFKHEGKIADWVGTEITFKGGSFDSGKLQLSLRSVDNDGCGVLFHYHNPKNHYRFYLSKEGRIASLIRVENGKRTFLKVIYYKFKIGKFLPVSITFNDKAIDVHHDGKSVFGIIKETVPESLIGGTIGFFCAGNTDTSFTNISVSKPTTEATKQISTEKPPITQAGKPSASTPKMDLPVPPPKSAHVSKLKKPLLAVDKNQIQKLFKGQVTKLVPETLHATVNYNFSNHRQLEDFEGTRSPGGDTSGFEYAKNGVHIKSKSSWNNILLINRFETQNLRISFKYKNLKYSWKDFKIGIGVLGKNNNLVFSAEKERFRFSRQSQYGLGKALVGNPLKTIFPTAGSFELNIKEGTVSASVNGHNALTYKLSKGPPNRISIGGGMDTFYTLSQLEISGRLKPSWIKKALAARKPLKVSQADVQNLFNTKIRRFDPLTLTIDLSYDFNTAEQSKDWSWSTYGKKLKEEGQVVLENRALKISNTNRTLLLNAYFTQVQANVEFVISGQKESIMLTALDSGKGSFLGITPTNTYAKAYISKCIGSRLQVLGSQRPSPFRFIKGTKYVKGVVQLRANENVIEGAAGNVRFQYKGHSLIKGHVGLRAPESTGYFDNFRVVGKLDKEWLKSQLKVMKTPEQKPKN